MKSKLLSLIKNKSFITGVLVGVFITTLAAGVLVSLTSPPPNSKHLKGTMSGSNPAIGTFCVIVDTLHIYYCSSTPMPQYIVQFIKAEDRILCTGQAGLKINQKVQVSEYVTGKCGLNMYVSATSR